MTTFSDVLDDVVLFIQDRNPLFGYGSTIVEPMELSANFGPTVWGTTTHDAVGIDEPFFAYNYLAHAVVGEILRINHTTHLYSIFAPTLTEKLRFVDRLLRVLPVSLTENMGLHDAMLISRGAIIMQRMGFNASFIFTHYASLTLTDAIRFSSSVLNFFGGGTVDGLGIHDAFSVEFSFDRALTDALGLHPEISANTLFMRIVDNDFGFDDPTAIQSIFNSAILNETIEFSIGAIDPGGGFTTWAVNTRTGAVTEYSNYYFNSFLQIGNEFYGANDDGLWLLNAETDNGANIVADIKGAMLSFGGSRFSQLDGIYLGLRVDDNARDFVLKLMAPNAGVGGGDAVFYYNFRPRNMETTRVNIGKGFRYRYFQWEIITPGTDFDLDEIEFVPIISKRRVR